MLATWNQSVHFQYFCYPMHWLLYTSCIFCRINFPLVQ